MRDSEIPDENLDVPETRTPDGGSSVKAIGDIEPSAKAVEDAYLIQTRDLMDTSSRAYNGTFARELSLIELDDDGLNALDVAIEKGHASSLDSAIDKVMQLLSQDIIYRLWIDSPFVSVEGVELAGHQKCFGCGGEAPNKSALCNAVCKDLGQESGADVKRITIHITRLLAAMEVFGLVKAVEVRSNLFSIEVQPRLDVIMRASLGASGEVFDKQIGEGPSCDD